MIFFGIDGKEYGLADLNHFTGRELSTIKSLSGVRAGELSGGLKAGDSDLCVALLCIAMKRAGKEPNVDAILDRDFGDLTVRAVDDEPEAEVDAGPLAVAEPASIAAPVTE